MEAPEFLRLRDYLKRTTGYDLKVIDTGINGSIVKYGGSLANDLIGDIWQFPDEYDKLMTEFLFNPCVYIYDEGC